MSGRAGGRLGQALSYELRRQELGCLCSLTERMALDGVCGQDCWMHGTGCARLPAPLPAWGVQTSTTCACGRGAGWSWWAATQHASRCASSKPSTQGMHSARHLAWFDILPLHCMHRAWKPWMTLIPNSSPQQLAPHPFQA